MLRTTIWAQGTHWFLAVLTLSPLTRYKEALGGFDDAITGGEMSETGCKTREREDSSPNEPPFPEERFVTQHQLVLDDRSIAYEASAEWIKLRRIHKPIAHIFHTAYIDSSAAIESRPLTFVFNGGPGAASAYLHMGAVGPKRICFGPNGTLPPGPTRIVDNLESWLAFTDLVFIDPAGTGFSRSLKDEKREEKSDSDSKKPERNSPEENPEFWEIERDLDSLGEFICRFLSRHHRWTSPLFIAGESYGGFRVARMARRLQEKHGVGLCGALLISPAIELEALAGSDYDLTYWVEVFPSFAAAAHQHARTRAIDRGTPLTDVMEAAEAFARNDLSRWLAHGERFPVEERTQVVRRMSQLCGLDEHLIERANGRINATLFCRELLRDQRKLCGRYDAAITTTDPFPDRHDFEGPDALWSFDRLFTGAVNHHIRANLKVATELDYRLLSHEVNQAWKDGNDKQQFYRKVAGAMDDLRYGMSLNEHMHVFFCHGYFDLVTPYFGTSRLIDLMKLTSPQREKVESCNFVGGHMFYSWDASRIAFRDKTAAFYRKAGASV
jgi:carboxypeptidase C (cathepsin A)